MNFFSGSGRRKRTTGVGDLRDLTDRIIGGGIEVHKHLGPGLLESVYEAALARELVLRNLQINRQRRVPVAYKGESVGHHRLDLVVEDLVVVEIKAVPTVPMKVGLLMNFGALHLARSIRRITRP